MHDTAVLRARIQAALASLPLATLGLGLALTGCDPAPSTGRPPAKSSGKPIPTKTPEPPVDPRLWLPLDDSVYTIEGDRAFGETGPDRPDEWGNDPFDPDGEEEQGCPSGDWCGPVAVADMFAIDDTPRINGCPEKLRGSSKPPVKPSDARVKGLSLNPVMMGRLYPIATGEEREKTGDDSMCCYHWYDYCSGRPLLDGDCEDPRAEGVVAPLRPGSSWTDSDAADERLAGLETPRRVRERAAREWLDDAAMEHASVAAFARATLELLAVGAPAELVAGCRAAAQDEIEHARLCFAMARRALGRDASFEPGELPTRAMAPRRGGLAALAGDTFAEGCVGETIAALIAARAAAACEDPAARAALETIAEDEARHAGLAWATVAYCCRRGGAEVTRAVQARAAELLALVEPNEDMSDKPDDEALARAGRLGAPARARARRDAWRELIGPTLASLVGVARDDARLA